MTEIDPQIEEALGALKAALLRTFATAAAEQPPVEALTLRTIASRSKVPREVARAVLWLLWDDGKVVGAEAGVWLLAPPGETKRIRRAGWVEYG